MQGLLGKKIGMTQIYRADGEAIPVTVVKAGPCVVVQRKTTEKDGYEAAQIGLVDGAPPRNVNAPMRGHFKKAGVAPTYRLVEVPFDDDADPQPGDQIKVGMFLRDQYVDVVGTGKGKGFQGVIKRHGFGGGRASHGSMFHRAPGSVGQSASPSRVFPGIKLPGQTGNKRITTKQLEVVRILEDENLIFLKGSVPGAKNGLVLLTRSRKGQGQREPLEQELAAQAAEEEAQAAAEAPETEATEAEAAPEEANAPEDAETDADGGEE